MTSPGRPHIEPTLISAYDTFAQAKARGTVPTAGAPFDPASSPLHGRTVFIVGAPRSGTSWLQQLLVLHPQIVGAGEMHVFCEGVGALFDNHEGTDPYSGLSGWVTRPELVALVRALIDGMMTTLRDALRPEATHVLDKTPNHVPYAARLAEVYPDAAFVQIVRDGRDSVASAQDLWSWSSDYAATAQVAGRWRDAVLDCRRHLSGLRYVEVRYEDLLTDTAAGLARIYDVIGLPYDEVFLTRCVEFGRTPINLRPSRTDVSTRKWADIPVDVEREVLLAAGDLLVELGYIDEQHRRAVLAHRSLRRTSREVAVAGRRARASAARKVAAARSRRDPRRRRRLVVRRGAQAALDALAAGRSPASALAPDVVLLDGERRLEGVADVAACLGEVLAAARLLTLDADERAAAARFSGASDGIELVTMRVDKRGAVDEVALTRTRS